MFLKLFLVYLVISFSTCRHVQFYRKDYTYFEEFDAFYKLHWDGNGATWNTAFFACENEGSQLFYPKAPEEWKIVNNLIEIRGLLDENFTDIYVGIKNDGIEEFITVDGLTTPSPLSNDNNLNNTELCTTMEIENGSLHINLCYNEDSSSKPFVCKKVEDVTCPTIDKGYQYMKETKKCYKVNKMSQTWHDALNSCVMEGGLLVNIESEMEAKLILKLIQGGINYHAGFRKIPPYNDFYTMKGQNLKDTYERFYYDRNRNDQNDCGAIVNHDSLYLAQVACNKMYPFVCEMEVTQ
ncbi:secretory phospholipase A2 receptor [Amyelois transitella]|uniref:secretory phospholipase A2 receptor n=1 Tax=Amyelois transitella TaxID=680683 RepID=UPI00067D9FA2|nr:secretory phospholipase A2 receptor [Amyelois transitella]